jgi:hypothetical protein
MIVALSIPRQTSAEVSAPVQSRRHMVVHMKPSVLLRLSSWSRSLRCSLCGLVSSCAEPAAARSHRWHTQHRSGMREGHKTHQGDVEGVGVRTAVVGSGGRRVTLPFRKGMAVQLKTHASGPAVQLSCAERRAQATLPYLVGPPKRVGNDELPRLCMAPRARDVWCMLCV